MKILSVLFPGSAALDLIGPTTAWGLNPNSEFQTVARTAGPVKVDMGLEVVATHNLDNCWSSEDRQHERPPAKVAPSFGPARRDIRCRTRTLAALGAVGTAGVKRTGLKQESHYK